MLKTLSVGLCFLFLALNGIPAADPPAKAPAGNEALRKSLTYLEKEGLAWKEARKCGSCHHVPLMVWAQNEARKKGLKVDEAAFKDASTFLLAPDDRGKMLPGQVAMDTYEQAQRTPGDYEAQVSQRPIAVHGLEHLSATDRGVTMFRNLVRKGIRAVRDGHDPQGLSRSDNVVLSTFCNDTVVHQPAEGDAATDAEMLRSIGRRLAEGYVKNPPLLPPG